MVAEITDLEVVETRKLASFRTVDAIEPIEGADMIELAVIGGWKVVIKKGEFAVGDPCVYFEIDTFLPEHDGCQPWQFLIDKQPRMMGDVKGHRLRTIKLRGQISQGLILPVRAFPAAQYVLAQDPVVLAMLGGYLDPLTLAEAENLRFGLYEHEAGLDPRDLNLNTLLKVVKWDPPLPASLSGMAEGLFPSWIRKTDQERAQNLKDEIFGYEDGITEVLNFENLPEEAFTKGHFRRVDGKVFKVLPGKADQDARYEITMKMDGSSATFFHRNGEVGVCSRNLQLKICEDNKENSFVRMLFDSGLNWALPNYGNIAVQGELMGPGIQNNRENLKDFKLYIFDVQLLDEGRYMTPAERFEFVKDLGQRGVDVFGKVHHAPLRTADGWIDHVFDLPKDFEGVTLQELGLDTMEKLLAFAEGPSLVHPIREGLVYKKVDGSFSFKTISNAYLAKEKD